MEEEVRDILRTASRKREKGPSVGLGTEISQIFAQRGLDKPIQELRGYTIQLPDFEG